MFRRQTVEKHFVSSIYFEVEIQLRLNMGTGGDCCCVAEAGNSRSASTESSKKGQAVGTDKVESQERVNDLGKRQQTAKIFDDLFGWEVQIDGSNNNLNRDHLEDQRQGDLESCLVLTTTTLT